jgi:hypothetical protein
MQRKGSHAGLQLALVIFLTIAFKNKDEQEETERENVVEIIH